MPITEDGARRLHEMLTKRDTGERVRHLQELGEVTPSQFEQIKEHFGKRGRKFTSSAIEITSNDIIHIHNAKVTRDGMSIQDVVDIFIMAFDEKAVVDHAASHRSDRAVLVYDGYHAVVKHSREKEKVSVGSVLVTTVIDKG